jgi:hypothetical protein
MRMGQEWNTATAEEYLVISPVAMVY